MRIAGCIAWTLLCLALFAAAAFLSWAAVDLLATIERAREGGQDLFFIEEERTHALLGGFVALTCWIGGSLAGTVALRAWRSR
jgi:hypothetical protein